MFKKSTVIKLLSKHGGTHVFLTLRSAWLAQGPQDRSEAILQQGLNPQRNFPSSCILKCNDLPQILENLGTGRILSTDWTDPSYGNNWENTSQP